MKTQVVGLRLDALTKQRLEFAAAQRGLDPAGFARRAVEIGIAEALAEMSTELLERPLPTRGRPRKVAEAAVSPPVPAVPADAA